MAGRFNPFQFLQGFHCMPSLFFRHRRAFEMPCLRCRLRVAVLLLLSMKGIFRMAFARPLVQLDCDPCIDRSRYKLRAILHGSRGDDFWLQVESAMKQAASDMSVGLEVSLRPVKAAEGGSSLFDMAQEISEAAASKEFDALIVTIPDDIIQVVVEQAIEERQMPVFGLNLGYSVAHQIGVLGFAAQDEFVAGQAAADEILNRNPNITKAIYVQNDPSLNDRFDGFRSRLQEERAPDGRVRQVDYVKVEPAEQFSHVTALQAIFQSCQYEAVLLGGSASVEVAVAALDSSECRGRSIMGSFDDTPDLITQIVKGNLAFGVGQQPYLQAVLPVYLAAIYATTGKTLALPVEEQVYLSGPNIISTQNIPTDTLQTCASDAFPICPNTMAPNGGTASCSCIDRSNIRIGGVLHGVTTDSFWDPVFAAANQAAFDMGIQLDLIRFKPSADETDVFRQMAARIKTLCEGGVDGIFVTIPSDIVIGAIERCLELRVPIVSVNAGGDISLEMGLLHHIGMVEFSAGYAAAQQYMVMEGIREAYCLDHAPGNIVTLQRCQGFEAALSTPGSDIAYKGRIEVPLDNRAQYEMIVQTAISFDGDWSGVGILLCGSTQVEVYRASLASLHPAAVVGSFDIAPDLLAGLDDGIFIFGIDQQPSLQGTMPVILLALQVYTKQSLKNHFVETGPNFVQSSPSAAAKICETNFFEVCPERPAEAMNFISTGVRVFGYCAFGLLLLLIFAAALWTFFYRDRWVVKISQPFFLYIILFGMLVCIMSIPFLGVETGYRFIQDGSSGQLTQEENPEIRKADAACMLVPWFYGLGFAITFSAIFAKIQRVKLIYLAGRHMRRKEITVHEVMNTMIVMLFIELVILLSWQFVSPHRWERTITAEEDGFPLESVGSCDSETGWYFYLSVIAFHVICLIYALVLSWQTKDINNEFAESSYLFLAVMFMFQIQCLAVPILALVQDSPDVFHFIQAIVIFSQNFTVLVLIFGPKMYKVIIGQADPVVSAAAPGRNGNPRTSLTRSRNGQRMSIRDSLDTGESAILQTSFRGTSSRRYTGDASTLGGAGLSFVAEQKSTLSNVDSFGLVDSSIGNDSSLPDSGSEVFKPPNRKNSGTHCQFGRGTQNESSSPSQPPITEASNELDSNNGHDSKTINTS